MAVILRKAKETDAGTMGRSREKVRRRPLLKPGYRAGPEKLTARRRAAEQPGSTFRQQRLPGRDLIRVNIVKLRQFGQHLLALQGSQRHFGLEGRRMVTAAPFRHHLSCSPASSPSSGRNSTYPGVQIRPATSLRADGLSRVHEKLFQVKKDTHKNTSPVRAENIAAG
jgi:hypothetical protein